MEAERRQDLVDNSAISRARHMKAVRQRCLSGEVVRCCQSVLGKLSVNPPSNTTENDTSYAPGRQVFKISWGLLERQHAEPELKTSIVNFIFGDFRSRANHQWIVTQRSRHGHVYGDNETVQGQYVGSFRVYNPAPARRRHHQRP